MKKKTAVYRFTETLFHVVKGNQEVYVDLEINYMDKSYIILNQIGDVSFKFSGYKKDIARKKAVLRAIGEAINFAEKEIN